MSGILSATSDHYRWLLRPALNLHVYLLFLRTGAIVNGYMPLSKWILSPSFDHYHWLIRLALTFIQTYTITANGRYLQLVNVNEHPHNPSGYFSVTFDHYRWLLRLALIFIEILRDTFGNFQPLSLTTSTCVNLHRDLPLISYYFERALSSICEHYNVNEHPCNPSWYFR